MATMTTVDTDALWAGIDDQRARTVRLLEGLAPAQWDHPSLCEGWTVRHVAAHLTLQQQRLRDVVAFTARHPRMLRSPSLNASIRESALLQAQLLSTDQILERISSGIGTRRHNVFVTPLETLTDILVHGQDIAIPLGLDLPMPTSLSAIAATRRWDTRHTWLATVNRRLPVDSYRLHATDTDWSRGSGPEVAGPVGAILLLLTGRTAALVQLAGPGLETLRREADTQA